MSVKEHSSDNNLNKDGDSNSRRNKKTPLFEDFNNIIKEQN